jgi:serine/threonine protein kinase
MLSTQLDLNPDKYLQHLDTDAPSPSSPPPIHTELELPAFAIPSEPMPTPIAQEPTPSSPFQPATTQKLPSPYRMDATIPIPEDFQTSMFLGDAATQLAEATRGHITSADTDFSLVGQSFGNFLILKEVGAGAFGTVYRARQQHLNNDVALKVLHINKQNQPLVIERFQREARALWQLKHKNIVAFYDMGQLPGVGVYLMMEYLSGMGLDQRFNITKQWTIQDILNVVPPLCDALGTIHQQGIIHRDLKPSNIFLHEENGQVIPKLLDFGIAGLTDGSSELTAAGSFLGTAQYVSPEQARGLKQIDGRADLYSLGVVLFRMLTGQLPFQAESQMAIIFKHMHQDAPSLGQAFPYKSWCEPLEIFICKALSKEAINRPANAIEFKRELLSALLAQAQHDRNDQTAPDLNSHLSSSSQDELAAYIMEHGILPNESSPTMDVTPDNQPPVHNSPRGPSYPILVMGAIILVLLGLVIYMAFFK